MTYEPFTATGELPGLVRRLRPATLVLDVEPLVSPWDDSQESLDRGLAHAVAVMSEIPELSVLCFATNSARAPASLPRSAALRVEYLVSAHKPGRTAPYLHWPRPGAVAGDQVLTDGLLARRLGYAFLHYRLDPRQMPVRPRLLALPGELVRPLVFARSRDRPSA